MKFLSIIAASLAAYASAQKQSFRGWQQKDTDTKRQRPQTKNGSQDNKGQFQWPQQKGGSQQWQKQKGGSQDKNKGQFQWPQQKGNNNGQNGGSKDNKGRWPRKNNGGSKRGKEQCPPKIDDKLLKQYSDEFHALDVDGNNVLDGKEFKEAGDKISDAFKSYRKGKKPSWYHKRPSRPSRSSGGSNDQNSGKPSWGNNNGGKPSWGNNNGGGRGNTNGGGRPSHRGNTNGGRPSRGKTNGRPSTNDNNNNGGLRFGGNNRRLDDESQNFMKYLQQHGFGTPTKPKKTQETKDTEDVKRAMQVFSKFDKDGNHKITLCEYENAMYRTQALEKTMKSRTNGYRGKYNRGDKGDVVVVHG